MGFAMCTADEMTGESAPAFPPLAFPGSFPPFLPPLRTPAFGLSAGWAISRTRLPPGSQETRSPSKRITWMEG